MEDAVSPETPSLKTFLWALFQLGNSAARAFTLPSKLASYPDGAVSLDNFQKDRRRTIVETFSIPNEKVAKIKYLCKENKVTVTNFLAALIILLTDTLISSERVARPFRFLLSVGLRPLLSPKSNLGSNFNPADWTNGTVACAGVVIHHSNVKLPSTGILHVKYII
jgi:hypothetical protein